MESLLNAVKCTAYRYMHPRESENLSDEQIRSRFDAKYGGIRSATIKRILPANIKPNLFKGRKEFVHLVISDHCIVLPQTYDAERQIVLPCLVTGLQGPPHLEDLLFPPNGPQLRLDYPTLVEALNWLHKHGFVRDDSLSQVTTDVVDDATFESIYDDFWFSRIVDETRGSNREEDESPIIHDGEKSFPPCSERREFAALVSLRYHYRHAVEYVMAADLGEEGALDVYSDGSGHEFGQVTSTISFIHAGNLLDWLTRSGYFRYEPEYSELYQKIIRRASDDWASDDLMLTEEVVPKIHVKVFSRELLGDENHDHGEML